MTVEPEVKPALSTEMAAKIVNSDPALDEPFDSQEGWRIARQSLLREVVRYGGQGAIVLVLLGVIGSAGYWSLTEMKSLPSYMNKLAQPFILPPPVAARLQPEPESAALRVAEEKARAKVPQKKHHHRPRNQQIAAKVGRQSNGYAATSDDPTGGRIIYSDGMITQYSWNK